MNNSFAPLLSTHRVHNRLIYLILGLRIPYVKYQAGERIEQILIGPSNLNAVITTIKPGYRPLLALERYGYIARIGSVIDRGFPVRRPVRSRSRTGRPHF